MTPVARVRRISGLCWTVRPPTPPCEVAGLLSRCNRDSTRCICARADCDRAQCANLPTSSRATRRRNRLTHLSVVLASASLSVCADQMRSDERYRSAEDCCVALAWCQARTHALRGGTAVADATTTARDSEARDPPILAGERATSERLRVPGCADESPDIAPACADSADWTHARFGTLHGYHGLSLPPSYRRGRRQRSAARGSVACAGNASRTRARTSTANDTQRRTLAREG